MIHSTEPVGRRALLLSAYDAPSHRQWRQTLCRMFPDIDWSVLTLPPRHFSWRLRGNSLSWAFGERETLTRHHDFLLCTSMTDLSALRGFVPELGQLPAAVYFHENQFDYPQSSRQTRNVEPQILNLYTALSADRVLFNSAHNRDSMLHGAEALLRKMPDLVPADLVTQLAGRCEVLPVPLPDELYAPAAAKRKPGPLQIAWNHRWEYDKGPEQLLHLGRQLIEKGVRFRMHLLGQQFRQLPPAMESLCELLTEHYRATDIAPGHIGHIPDRQEYLELLGHCDVVLSTSLHDFQGLSLLEGIAAGCTPLAPSRMVYPEYLPEECLYACDPDPASESAYAAARLEQWARQIEQGIALPVVNADQFRASELRADYARLFRALERSN